MAEKEEKKKNIAKTSADTQPIEKAEEKAKKPTKDKKSKKMVSKDVKVPEKESSEKKSARAGKKKTVKEVDSGSKGKSTEAKEKTTSEKPPRKAKKKEYMPRLYKRYLDDIVSKMTKRFGYKNKFEVPKLTKIVLNIGMGEALQNNKVLDAAVEVLSIITGQKPIITKAKKSVSNFKLPVLNK